MTQLREQVRHARRAYEAPRYPGDLAVDLLVARRARRTRVFPAAVAGALAAAAVVVIAVRSVPPEPAVPVAVVPSPAPFNHVRPVPRTYAFPARMSLSIPAAPLVPATPPVSVSLTALNDLRGPYEALGPKLLQRLNWSNLMQPSATPKVPPPGLEATTQRAV